MAAEPDVDLACATIHRVRLPLAHAHAAAHGSESEREVILVELTDRDGTRGWGECPTMTEPSYVSEYTDGAWQILVERLVPAVLGVRPMTVVGHRSARWALETAIADLRARHDGISLRDAWAGPTGGRLRIPSTAVLGVERDLDHLVSRVAAALAAGHRSVKVKITADWNVEPLGALRRTWPDLDLAADANGSLPIGDDRLFAAIEALGLAYVEQPLPAEDLTGSASLAGRLHTPVVLDEGVTSAASVATIAALGAADGVNAKPGRLGREAIAVARAAHDVGLEVVCGGMLETGVGRAAALAVAALPECTLPSDLGPSVSYFASDLTDPFLLDANGTLEVPDGPGLGVAPDVQRLDAATRQRATLER